MQEKNSQHRNQKIGRDKKGGPLVCPGKAGQREGGYGDYPLMGDLWDLNKINLKKSIKEKTRR